MDTTEFVNLIVALMNPDNDTRNNGERQLLHLKESNADQLYHMLVETMRRCPDVGVRSMCSILMRSESFSVEDTQPEKQMWKRLSPQCKEVIKSECLQAMQEEPERTVAKKICDTIGEMGAYVNKNNEQWPELLPYLFNCTKSESPHIRENGLNVFGRLTAYMGATMAQYSEVLREIFEAALNDQLFEVRLAGLSATTALLVATEDPNTKMVFEPLIPLMLDTISTALNNQDEDLAISAIQLFNDVAESAPKFLKRHLGLVINAMLTICAATTLDPSTRHMALEFLTILAEKAAPMLRKFPDFANNVFPAALFMMVDLQEEDDWNDQVDSLDSMDVTNADFAEQAVDRIACAIGGRTILPLAEQYLPQMLASGDWQYRHAALMCVSALGEGCRDAMETKLGSIVAMCEPFFRDPHYRVRYAACQAFGQMCIDFQPGIQNTFHQQILSNLAVGMQDFDHPRVQAHAAAALLNFSNSCRKEIIAPYLEPLLTALMEMLRQGRTRAQEQALSAIASIADAARDAFANYYDHFMPLLKDILFSPATEGYLLLRGKAIECISMLGLAVGRERFREDARLVMEHMVQTEANAMKADDPQIPYMLQAWARICQSLQEDFIPYLPTVMPPLLAAAEIRPAYSMSEATDRETHAAGWQSVVLGDARIGIKTSVLEDKATACRMLVCYVRDLRDGFMQYVDRVSRIMVPLLKFYFHDDVRIAACECCPFLLAATATHVVKTSQDVEFLQELYQYILSSLLDVIHAEPDMQVLCLELDALCDSITAVGADSLNRDQMNGIVEHLKVLLHDMEGRANKRAEKRNDEDYDEDLKEDLEEEESLDELILREIANVLEAIFKTHRDNFIPVFVNIMPYFHTLLQPDRVKYERQWAMCVFDTVVEFAGEAAFELLPQFADLMFQYASDPEHTVRQAAIFGLGVCGQCLGQQYLPHLQTTIDALKHAMSLHGAWEGEMKSVSENAISALVKIAETHPQHVNLPEMWHMILEGLPFEEDHLEGCYVYKVVCTHIENNDELVLGENGANVPHLLNVLVTCLGTEFADEELTVRVVNIIRTAKEAVSDDVFNQMVGNMSQEAQQKIGHALQLEQL